MGFDIEFVSVFRFFFLIYFSFPYRIFYCELILTESLEKEEVRESKSKSVCRILSHELPFIRALY
jgi:hypothetical protein